MHTILGANGQIATELARALAAMNAGPIRLVSRHPRRVNEGDALVAADLLDAAQTQEAVRGSSVVYFTAGLPADTRLWQTQFPPMLRHALDAARAAGAKFAYFDNTYMYPQNANLQTEETSFAPVGPKGRVRAEMATMVLAEMARGEIPVLIGRAPEFYGPGRTQSVTNTLVLEPLKAGQKARVPVRDDTRRTLIWTPDASRALALLGSSADTFGQTWHLPCCDERPTYREFVTLACQALGRPFGETVLPAWLLRLAAHVSKPVGELAELLPRYAHDNLFDSAKFKGRFPDFAVTTYREGLAQIAREADARPAT